MNDMKKLAARLHDLAPYSECVKTCEEIIEIAHKIDAYIKAQESAEPVFVVFDGPPGPECGRFVEVETKDGRSVRVDGCEWVHRTDGYWTLGPLYAAPPPREPITREALVQAVKREGYGPEQSATDAVTAICERILSALGIEVKP